MKPEKQDTAFIRELKHQPTAWLFLYILLGILGFTSSFLWDSSASLRIVLLFVSGLILGISTEKLVTRGIRKVALTMRKEEE